MTIDILCRVVDNFGDIGVVYRLAKALSDCDATIKLRLIVDDLYAFQKLCPAVNPSLAFQQLGSWQLFRWDTGWDAVLDVAGQEKPRFVLECFSCGRPDWFEEILFDKNDTNTCWIIDIEHLSAEDFAEDFHLMPSLTRSSLVKKVMFMPGFTEKTGGLIIDAEFKRLCEAYTKAEAEITDTQLPASVGSLAKLRLDWALRTGLHSALPSEAEHHFWLPIFSYARNYDRIVADLALFHQDQSLVIFAAAGPSQECLLSAWEKVGKPFPLIKLPFLGQESWDELLLASNFLIVRGEESLSRAALSGKPFLWHAYALEGYHQQVKVQALLERLQKFFPPELFETYRDVSFAFNDRERDGDDVRGIEELLPLLQNEVKLRHSFEYFSQELLKRPDMACRLLTYIHDLV